MGDSETTRKLTANSSKDYTATLTRATNRAKAALPTSSSEGSTGETAIYKTGIAVHIPLILHIVLKTSKRSGVGFSGRALCLACVKTQVQSPTHQKEEKLARATHCWGVLTLGDKSGPPCKKAAYLSAVVHNQVDHLLHHVLTGFAENTKLGCDQLLL
jgi:hypothetical protein